MSARSLVLAVAKWILPTRAREGLLQMRSRYRTSRVGRWLALVGAVRYDFRRFRRHSSAITGADNQAKLRARITIDYHRLEKGLSLPKIKIGFGEAVFNRLIDACRDYISRYGVDQTMAVTVNVLDVYAAHRASTDGFPQPLAQALANLKAQAAEHRRLSEEGGTQAFSPDDCDPGAAEHFSRLVQTRHSIRNFTGAPVAPESIARALALAARSPSVCNRQSCGAYTFYTAEDKARVLTFQNGNTGFGHLAGAVVLVVSDLSCFTSEAERYQGWIDGGMFAMSLIYALHSQGLGTCCLNWSATVQDDQDLREAVALRPQDNVIMMIAVGHLPPALQVACSPRIPLAEVLRNQAP